MKKQIYFLVSLLSLIGFSSSAWAQSSTGVAPYPGATHHYNVTSTSGSSYSWKVYKGSIATEVTSDLAANGITTFSPSNNSLTVKWSTTAKPGDEYIIVVEEETASHCKNSKGLPVKITASEFDLTVASGGDACYTGPVTIAWVGGVAATNVTYDHGNAQAVYTISATGLGASETWSFKPNFSWTQSNISVVSTVVDKAGTPLTADAGTGVYTVAGGNGSVTVTVVFENGNIYDNSKPDNAQDYSATLKLTDIASGTGAVQKTGAASGVDEISLNITRPNTTQINHD